MSPQRQGTAIATVGAVIALALLCSSASASLIITPNGPGEGESGFSVKAGALRPPPLGSVRNITAPSNFKCNTANLYVKAASIKLVNGRINFVGLAYADKFRAPSVLGTLTWKGSLTSGTIRFQTKKTVVARPPKTVIRNRPCDTGTLRYKVRSR